jgi:hypothetical protein
MGGRASSRSIGLASTSHSRAAFAVAFVVAASAWVVAGQTTSGPPYGTVRFTNDGIQFRARTKPSCKAIPEFLGCHLRKDPNRLQPNWRI